LSLIAGRALDRVLGVDQKKSARSLHPIAGAASIGLGQVLDGGRLSRGSGSMQQHRNICIGAFALLAAVLVTAPAGAQTKSLYDRLGGKPAITAVVAEFVARVAADARINHFFAHTDIDHLKKELVDQICAGSGGPCKYTGRSMKDAHEGMGVAGADFNALVEDLVGALDKFKVPEKEKSDLLAVLGPMKSDIVEKP
jgi:hemoglobin